MSKDTVCEANLRGTATTPEAIMASKSGPVDIESTAKQLAAATDDLSSQRLYHGTRADLKPGDLIEPAGDVVMVTRLDRLARSTRDLLNILATITGKKAGFRSLGDAWADSRTAHGRLMLTV
jgi:hypothetical protein